MNIKNAISVTTLTLATFCLSNNCYAAGFVTYDGVEVERSSIERNIKKVPLKTIRKVDHNPKTTSSRSTCTGTTQSSADKTVRKWDIPACEIN